MIDPAPILYALLMVVILLVILILRAIAIRKDNPHDRSPE